MYLRGCDRAAGNTAVRAAHCAARRRKDGGGGCGLSQRAWRVLVDPEGAGPEDLRITSKNYSKESTAGILIYIYMYRNSSSVVLMHSVCASCDRNTCRGITAG